MTAPTATLVESLIEQAMDFAWGTETCQLSGWRYPSKWMRIAWDQPGTSHWQYDTAGPDTELVVDVALAVAVTVSEATTSNFDREACAAGLPKREFSPDELAYCRLLESFFGPVSGDDDAAADNAVRARLARHVYVGIRSTREGANLIMFVAHRAFSRPRRNQPSTSAPSRRRGRRSTSAA